MQEDFLHYLWRYALYPANRLFTREGEQVSVLNPGQYNLNAGPDFLMARIRIGQTIWAGHVEIHVRSSDWYRHHHEHDPAYQTVVLHVVYEDDAQVLNVQGKPVPTIRLPINERYLTHYHEILATMETIPCKKSFSAIPDFERMQHFERMGIERMENRIAQLQERLKNCRGSFEDVLFQVLFRYFGFGVNQAAFDQLGNQIALKVIRSTRANHFAVEALLFGISGLIPDQPSPDPYIRALSSEFAFLKRKYNLDPLPANEWKFMRMRPANFPTLRIAQLASFIHHHPNLIEKVVATHGMLNPDDFELHLSLFWKRHFDFKKPSCTHQTYMGSDTILLLRINALLPFAAFWAREHGDDRAYERWHHQLLHLPPENNRILRLWKTMGMMAENAFLSQSSLHLYSRYCRERKCLSCSLGQFLIRSD